MRRLLSIISVLLCVPAIAACATSTSTSKFHGSERAAAETVANLQSDATGGEQKKVCERDLAAQVVTKLGGRKGCESAVKSQLSEIDSTEVDVEAVHVSGTTATATLKSVFKGKKKSSTATLVLEGGKWKISALS